MLAEDRLALPNRGLNRPDERDRREDPPSGRGDCAPTVHTPRPRASPGAFRSSRDLGLGVGC